LLLVLRFFCYSLYKRNGLFVNVPETETFNSSKP
jgi:hypothetical protein